MKKIYIIILAFLFIIATASVGLCKGVLVAGYSFDDGSEKIAKDVTGNGHDGVVKDAKAVVGKFGKALEFDGSTSQVEIPTDDELNIKDAVTVEAWVKPTKYNALSAVVQKWGDISNRRQYLLCFVNAKVRMYISGAGNTWPSSESKTDVKTGEWTHIAGTYDSKNIKVYINGVMENSVANVEGLFVSDLPAWIGGYGPDAEFGDNRHFPGVIDEARYWSGALDDNEIKDAMNISTAAMMAVSNQGKLSTVWGNLRKLN